MNSTEARRVGGVAPFLATLSERVWRIVAAVWRNAAERVDASQLGEDHEIAIGRLTGAR